MTVSKAAAYGLALFAFALGCGSADASESLIELTTGGLDFIKTSGAAPLVLDSEDVAISPAKVTFKYRVSTPGPGPVRLDLAFHYPDLDFSDPDATYAIPGSDLVNFLNAKVKVGGAAAAMSLSQTASLDGKSVTAALAKAELPLVPIGDFRARLAATSPEARKSLEAGGLVRREGTTVEGKPLLFPAWTVKTDGALKVTIEPAKPVEIELAYKPSVGIRQDSLLRKALRDNEGLAPDVAEEKRLFCSDTRFLKALDALAGADEANVAQVRELRIRVLMRRPQASRMPAVAYSLSVDKGKSSRIASFCSQHLNKTSPTTFVTKMSNYVPQPEFDLLLIEGRKPASGQEPRRAPPPNRVAPFVGAEPSRQ